MSLPRLDVGAVDHRRQDDARAEQGRHAGLLVEEDEPEGSYPDMGRSPHFPVVFSRRPSDDIDKRTLSLVATFVSRVF